MILMLSVDEAAMLERSLPPAVAQDEVLVVDNASTDGTAELAERLGARVLRLDERVSYAAAMNAGLAATEGDVLLLNADCFLDAGAVAAAARHLADPTVGSVAFRVRQDAHPDRIDAAGMWIDRRRKNGLVGHGDPVAAHAAVRDVFGADGACALYRRAALAGGFDEDMALWITDADLAWRARNAGWRCVFEPAATASHVRTYSPSKRPQTSREHRRIQFRNRYLMMVRNETWASLVRNAPWIVAYEVLALGHVLLRERFLAQGYVEAVRLAPRVRRRRMATSSGS